MPCLPQVRLNSVALDVLAERSPIGDTHRKQQWRWRGMLLDFPKGNRGVPGQSRAFPGDTAQKPADGRSPI